MPLFTVISFSTPILALECNGLGANDKADTGICGPNNNETVQESVQPILNVFYFVIGFLAVFFIVFGGIKYIMSSGDANKTATAKNTILYAAIGLIVALAAYAITNFVYERMTQ